MPETARRSRVLPIVLSTSLLQTACATVEVFKDLSVGHTGCRPAEMQIDHLQPNQSFGYTWTVTCQGTGFLCSEMPKDVACHERLRAPSTPST